MTRDEILAMPAGREMDALVEKLAGVVERCGYFCEVSYDGVWVCKVGKFGAAAPTAPLAICRAALLATLEE